MGVSSLSKKRTLFRRLPAPACVRERQPHLARSRTARYAPCSVQSRDVEQSAQTARAQRGKAMAQQQVVRAIYHAGMLQLLEPVDLPEGAELQITIPVVTARETPTSGPVYPTRPSTPDVLSHLSGLS